MNPTTGSTSEAGYQILHCPPEAAYQQVLLDWAKSGQHGQMPRPDPRRGLGCPESVGAQWAGAGRGMRTAFVREAAWT